MKKELAGQRRAAFYKDTESERGRASGNTNEGYRVTPELRNSVGVVESGDYPPLPHQTVPHSSAQAIGLGTRPTHILFAL